MGNMLVAISSEAAFSERYRPGLYVTPAQFCKELADNNVYEEHLEKNDWLNYNFTKTK